MKVTAIHLLVLCVLTSSIEVHGETWDHTKILDDGHYHVHWNYKNDIIVFQVEVKCRGYVGFGLSRDDLLKGSDIVIGWIKDGQMYFHDRHGVGNNVVPELDEQQDWHLLQATENDTHNVFKFYRKLQTCDEDDLEIDESTFKMIYAYSDEDPISDVDIAHHIWWKGYKSVRLLTLSPLSYGTSVEGLAHWPVRGNYVLTSEVKTIYWCKLVKSPKFGFGKKQHVVKAETVIQPGNEQLIHHMAILHCRYQDQIVESDIEFDCPKSDIRHENCNEYGLSYLIGAEDIVLPSNAAYPIMSDEYYILETHYENAMGVNRIDHSGFDFYYTPALREHEVSFMATGIMPTTTLVIPPHTENFTLVGHTNFKHFGSSFPKTGIHMYSLNLHGHMTVKRMIARHFRNQTELKPILEDKFFDFRLQNYDLLREEVLVLPDDQITVECTFSTMDRDAATFGGASSTSEMCEANFFYYPAIGPDTCFSKITVDTVKKLDGFSKEGNTFRHYGLEEDLRKLDWTKINIPMFNNITRYTPQTSCAKSLNNSKPEFESINYPEGYTPYKKPKSACKKVTIKDLEPSSGMQTKYKVEFVLLASLILFLNF